MGPLDIRSVSLVALKVDPGRLDVLRTCESDG